MLSSPPHRSGQTTATRSPRWSASCSPSCSPASSTAPCAPAATGWPPPSPRGDLTPGVDTRLRFLRRAIYLAIIVIGLAVALSQFAGVNKLATSVLASGALAAAVVGFAARQTLANVIAGVMLAITQPIRIGDLVTFEGETGTVEDVRLTYTYLRGDDGQRLIVPNERLAGGHPAQRHDRRRRP